MFGKMLRVPFDLVMNILSRLPVKTLLRCRCLSKSFCQLVDSPYFVDLHLSRSTDRNSDLRFYCISQMMDTIIGPVEADALDRATVPHKSFRLRNFCSGLIGACNGLFAVENFRSSSCIAFVNPSTKKVRKVRRPWKTCICSISFGGFG